LTLAEHGDTFSHSLSRAFSECEETLHLCGVANAPSGEGDNDGPP
jgi:hypothetical protein